MLRIGTLQDANAQQGNLNKRKREINKQGERPAGGCAVTALFCRPPQRLNFRRTAFCIKRRICGTVHLSALFKATTATLNLLWHFLPGNSTASNLGVKGSPHPYATVAVCNGLLSGCSAR